MCTFFLILHYIAFPISSSANPVSAMSQTSYDTMPPTSTAKSASNERAPASATTVLRNTRKKRATAAGSAKRAGPSPGASSAPTKPLLSEAEKRKNHINSERRRREAIKENLNTLRSCLPASRTNGKATGGLSESAILGECMSCFL